VEVRVHARGCWCRLIALAAVAGLVSAGCSHNRFTAQNAEIDSQWAQVESLLQQRSDLISDLAEVVKGYAAHERELFQAVADARARLAGARTPEEKIAAAKAESSALARLLKVVEDYPQLRADSLFIRLQDELAGTEHRVAQQRQRYNEKVREYNALRRQFPSNIAAGLFGLKERPLFEPPADEKQTPTVKAVR
jgi:LemA protein